MNGITIDIFPHLLFRGVFSPEGKWSLGGLMMQSDKKKPFWSYLEVHMMVVLMVVFMVNIFCQIFFRVLFKTPVFFAEELSRYAFLWMVFLGLSYATLHDKHIRVTLLVEKFPFTLQRITEILIHLLAIACFSHLGRKVEAAGDFETALSVFRQALTLPATLGAGIWNRCKYVPYQYQIAV